MAQRVFDDERGRGAALSAKATTLAGFSGTILAVVAALGRETLTSHLGAVGDPSVRVLFVVSILALTTAVTLAILGVLRTRVRLLIDSDQIIAFASEPWIDTDAADIDGNMLASIGQALREERKLNDHKARITDRSAVALLVGLLCVAAQAVLLGVDDLVH